MMEYIDFKIVLVHTREKIDPCSMDHDVLVLSVVLMSMCHTPLNFQS